MHVYGLLTWHFVGKTGCVIVEAPLEISREESDLAAIILDTIHTDDKTNQHVSAPVSTHDQKA